MAKKLKTVKDGIAHIKATFNNTIVTITDKQGDVISWYSAGMELKGSRKSTPFGGQIAAERAVRKAINDYGLRQLSVRVKGPGAGRESAIRALKVTLPEGIPIEISSIRDVSCIQHGGCKQPNRRRV